MKKRVLTSILVASGLASVLTGCVMMTPFTPKPLKDEAKGITTVRTTPYGCKVLGEVEGKDGRPNTNTVVPNFNQAREGAMNDLRNNALEVIGKNKRATLRIIEEIPTCLNDDCKNFRDQVVNYRVTAQIFECGNKE